MMAIKGISLIFWVVVVPFCMGYLPVRWVAKGKKNVGLVFVGGYFTMLSLCWLVTVPCILLVKYYSFRTMAAWFTVTALLAAAAGAGTLLWDCRRGKKYFPWPAFALRGMSIEVKIEWVLFFLLVFWQLYKSFTLASFDGDDAEYVAQSLVTQQSETMYLIKPYTGGTTSLDIRHSLAVLPIWVAFVGRRTGIHTTVLAHSILPFLLIPLTYAVYYGIGSQLMKKNREGLPAFMVIVALLQMFGNVSIYTNETFFLTRTWQGKSVAANVVIPATIWLLLLIFDGMDGEGRKGGRRTGKKRKAGLRAVQAGNPERMEERFGAGMPQAGLWALLCLANLTAGVCTSMGVFLNAVLVAAIAFWMMVAERRFSILVKAGFACLPNVIYMALYLFLHV